MNRAEAIPETLEALRGQCDRLRVAIDADDRQLGETIERPLGVTAHAQGPVNEDRSGALNGRGQHVQALGEEDRDVTLRRGAPALVRAARRIAHRIECFSHVAPPSR